MYNAKVEALVTVGAVSGSLVTVRRSRRKRERGPGESDTVCMASRIKVCVVYAMSKSVLGTV